jgi:hypothetical protein
MCQEGIPICSVTRGQGDVSIVVKRGKDASVQAVPEGDKTASLWIVLQGRWRRLNRLN